jgi:hypothetical protein
MMDVKYVFFKMQEDKIAFVLSDQENNELFSRKMLSDPKIIKFYFPDILDWTFEFDPTETSDCFVPWDGKEYFYLQVFDVNDEPKIIPTLGVNDQGDKHTFNTETNQQDIDSFFGYFDGKLFRRRI